MDPKLENYFDPNYFKNITNRKVIKIASRHSPSGIPISKIISINLSNKSNSKSQPRIPNWKIILTQITIKTILIRNPVLTFAKNIAVLLKLFWTRFLNKSNRKPVLTKYGIRYSSNFPRFLLLAFRNVVRIKIYNTA